MLAGLNRQPLDMKHRKRTNQGGTRHATRWEARLDLVADRM